METAKHGHVTLTWRGQRLADTSLDCHLVSQPLPSLQKKPVNTFLVVLSQHINLRKPVIAYMT